MRRRGVNGWKGKKTLKVENRRDAGDREARNWRGENIPNIEEKLE